MTANIIKPSPRIPVLDAARGVALVAMAIFHLGWDLENFGLARPGMTLEPHWVYFARSIATSFLILVGIGAWLAHNNGFNRKSFTKRIIMVGGAALLITVATYFATPDNFIFFGILHNITLSSLLILLFMRWPIFLLVPTALTIISAPLWARSPLFDAPWWWWSGLSQTLPKANDYVPLFPWFGWVMIGLIIARLLDKHNGWEFLSRISCADIFSTIMRFFGNNSLVFYLIHQPILIALVFIYARFIAGI